MTLKQRSKAKKGFSLAEFLIVVGILAVIAIIAIPITVGIINSSNKQNDEVLAATYSEYMQKFSTEQAGDAEFYTTLSDNGAEYDILKSTSGQGSFPGLTQLTERINNATSEDLVWDQIRKEACIAIKAYGEIELADNINYFVEAPTDDKMAFVYYYLTGTVALKPVDEMERSKISISDVNDGAVDTEDYWVYLDRRGGSGKAVGTSDPNANRDFYVLVLQFGTDTPVTGAEIMISPEAPSVGADRKITTSSTGRIVFRDSYFQFLISATHPAAAPYWNAEYYPDDNPHINLAQNPEVGTLENPFIIRLKMGTRGSLELYEKQKTYTYTSNGTIDFEEKDILLNWDNVFETNFTKKDSSVTGRDEEYYHSTPGSNPLNLMGFDESGISRFLLYGDYGMSIKNTTKNPVTGNSNFLTYTENITSDIWGIYNTENPEGYIDKTSEYPYPVVLTRTDTLVKGQIVSEKKEQPLHGEYEVCTGSIPATSGNGTSLTKDKVKLNTYVCVVNTKDHSIVYYSNLLTPSGQTSDGSYIYDFEIHMKNENDGKDEFNVYLITEYGVEDSTIITGKTTDALRVSAWPSTIKNDGSTYIFKTQSNGFAKVDLQKDVEVGTTKVKVLERYSSTSTRNLSYKVELYRQGYAQNSSFPNKVATVSGKSNNGEVTFTDIKQGFYTMVITLDEVFDGDYATLNGVPITVFIDDNNEFIFEIKPVLIQYSITCYPTDKDGNYITNDINLLNSNSKYGYEKIKITKAEIDGQTISATISIDAVTPDKNGALITFSYGKVCESLLLEQSVSCFKKSDKFYKEIKISKNYNDSFIIHRLENLGTVETEHPTACFEWFSENATYHYRQCQRCLYVHMRTKHNEEQKTNGNIIAVEPTYYASAEHIKNDSAVSSKHYAHCEVCDKYDKEESCSSLSDWTWTYNKYTKSSSHTGHTSATGITLTKNNSASNSTNKDTGYHYKYCTQCNQRVKSQLHKDEIVIQNVKGQCAPDPANAVAEYYLEDCICELHIENKGGIPDHVKYDVYYYGRWNEDYCLEKQNVTKCKNCALNISSRSCFYYSASESTSKVGYSTDMGYSEFWERRYLDKYAHENTDYHKNTCMQHYADFNYHLPCVTGAPTIYNPNVTLSEADKLDAKKPFNKVGTLWSYPSYGGAGYCKAYGASAKWEFERNDGLEINAVWRVLGTSTSYWDIKATPESLGKLTNRGGVLFYRDSSYGAIGIDPENGNRIRVTWTIFDDEEFREWSDLTEIRGKGCSHYTSKMYSINCCCRPFTWQISNYPSHGLTSPVAAFEGQDYYCFNTWNCYSRNPY